MGKMRLCLGNNSYILTRINGELMTINPEYAGTQDPVPVSTGGDFDLGDGLILHIYEQDHVSRYDDSYTGIQMELLQDGVDITRNSRGYMFHMSSGRMYVQESAYLSFFELGSGQYADGAFIKIYNLSPSDYNNPWADYEYDYYIDGLSPQRLVAILVISDGKWNLVPEDDQVYYGTTIQLPSSGEQVFVSGLYEIGSGSRAGFFFTLSSGHQTIAYYKYEYNGNTYTQESGYQMFYEIPPQGWPTPGDTITIYDINNFDIYDFQDYDYDEPRVRDVAPCLCTLTFGSDKIWHLV